MSILDPASVRAPGASVLGDRLDRDFFARSTIEVARALLGCELVAAMPDGCVRGRIVETEAYLGADDPASHAARLRAGRVEAMWGLPGIAYVYRSYGIHAMLNVVAKPEGATGAVLIRALEPVAGLMLMRQRRGIAVDQQLTSGPGRLSQAIGVTLADHGLDVVTSDRVWLVSGRPPATIAASPRIGISRGIELPWRFFEAGNRFVSSSRRGEPLIESFPRVEPD